MYPSALNRQEKVANGRVKHRIFTCSMSPKGPAQLWASTGFGFRT